MTSVVLVATMAVRRAALAEFRRFEQAASTIMARHGGAIERTIVAPGSTADELIEVHVVRFVDEAGFAAYRNDPEFRALGGLRDASVISTSVVVGHDGPNYGG